MAILKAREPARILIAIGKKKENRWHLQLTQRWVIQYNFDVNDVRWGADVRAHVSVHLKLPPWTRTPKQYQYMLQLDQRPISCPTCQKSLHRKELCGKPTRESVLDLFRSLRSIAFRHLLHCFTPRRGLQPYQASQNVRL